MIKKSLVALGALLVLFPTMAFAEDPSGAALNAGLSALWILIAGILVILMQGGFILLETGSTRMKNAGHVAGKTIFTVGLASLVYWAVGYGFAFGSDAGESLGKFIGIGDFFFAPDFQGDGASYPSTVFFVFQLAFAAVSLSIAWGGFAERAKLSVYLVFTLFFASVIYPVISHWIWAPTGWLFADGAQDFAGSTVVHLTGAMAALAGTILLKPRIGKFNKDGSSNEILGHNQVYTALSVLLLWVGWFGFNAGSKLSVTDGFFGYVAFNTQLGAAGGAVAALLISWLVLGKADITTTLNGALAGLVGITASCAFVEPWAAVVVGLVSGVLVFFSARFFDKIKVDDPIYAMSVHGAAGIWGTLSNGLFATDELSKFTATGQAGLFYGGGWEQLWVQVESVVVCGAFAFLASFVILWVIKQVMGLRVTEEQEIIGLDLSEHGNYGYPEQMKKSGTSSAI